jgi:hypothetical protein
MCFAIRVEDRPQFVESLNQGNIRSWEDLFEEVESSNWETSDSEDDQQSLCLDTLKSVVTATTYVAGCETKLTVCEKVLDLLCSDRPMVKLMDPARLRRVLQLRTLYQMHSLIEKMKLPYSARKFYRALTRRFYGGIKGKGEERSHRSFLNFVPKDDVDNYYQRRRYQELSENYFLGRGVKRNFDEAVNYHICAVHQSADSPTEKMYVGDRLNHILTQEKYKHERAKILMLLDKYDFDLDDYVEDSQDRYNYSSFAEELTDPTIYDACSDSSGVMDKLKAKKTNILESHLLTHDLMISAASYLPWFKSVSVT